MSIAVVYYSGTEKTAQLARAVIEGAMQSSSVPVLDLRIRPEQIHNGKFDDEAFLEALDRSSAIVFGSPTYMGMVAGPFKCVVDATSGRWFRQAWRDKLAAGFTTSGSPAGEKQSTLLYMATFAAQMGMIWVGSPDLPGQYFGQNEADAVNRLGAFMGVMSQIPPTEAGVATAGDLETARRLGSRVARLATRLGRETPASAEPTATAAE